MMSLSLHDFPKGTFDSERGLSVALAYYYADEKFLFHMNRSEKEDLISTIRSVRTKSELKILIII